MPSLQSLLDDLESDLSTAQTLVGSAPGPLDPPIRKIVKGLLDSSEIGISSVLVIIEDAGDAQTDLPISLVGIAALCVTLAQQAVAEAANSPPGPEYIGDQVKSIRWLINTANGYRDRVGA